MALKSDEKKEIYLKLIYCGPEEGGSSDNLHYIHTRLNPSQRGELTRLDPEGIEFFDFRPPNIPEIEGYKTVFHLYTYPGNDENPAVVKSLLKGTDGIIFIAPSNPDSADTNVDFMRKLASHLSNLQISIDAIPFVLQYNKKDPAEEEDIAELEASLNVFNAPSVQAEAAVGKGVLETFTQISKLVIKANQEGSHLASAVSAEQDSLLLELTRVSEGRERLGLAQQTPEVSTFEEEKPDMVVESVSEEMAESTLEDSMEQYGIDISKEEETDIPEGIEMEPGVELEEKEEGLGEELGGEDLGIEMGEEVPGFDEEAAIEMEGKAQDLEDLGDIEDLGGADIPEGIEMEPGFELGEGEEGLGEESGGEDLGIEMGEEVPGFEEEAAIEMEGVSEDLGDLGDLEDLVGADMPEGIEMEPGFELGGGEEGLGEELMEDDLGMEMGEEVPGFEEEATIEMEEVSEDLGNLGELEDLGGADMPEGIEMEPGFELGGGEEGLGEELGGEDLGIDLGEEIPGFEEEAAIEMEGVSEDLGDIEDLGEADMPEGIEMEPGFELGEEEETLSEIPEDLGVEDSEELIYGEMETQEGEGTPEAVEETPALAEESDQENFIPGDLEDVDGLEIPDDIGLEPDLGLNNGESLHPIQNPPEDNGMMEVEEAGQVDIPEYSAMKSAIKAVGEETVTPGFMETPIEIEKEKAEPSLQQPSEAVKGREIAEPVMAEVLDEIKASIGQPLSQGGGQFLIPLVLGSGSEQKTFNLKVSIVLEELQSLKQGAPKVVQQKEQTIKKIKTPLTQVEPIEDASFLDEVEEKSSKPKPVQAKPTQEPPEIKLDIRPDKGPSPKKEKKGFFAGLFGRK